MRMPIRPLAAMLLGFILAAPSLAFADAGGVALSTVLQLLAPYTEQILIALVVSLFWVAGHLVLLLKAGRVRHFGLASLAAVKVGVRAVEQKIAPMLRDAAGKLDPVAAAKCKAAAIAAAIAWLKGEGWSTWRLMLGLSDPKLEEALGLAVEAEVHDLPSVVPPSTPTEDAAAAKLTPAQVGAGLGKITAAVLLALGLGLPGQVVRADVDAGAVLVDGGAQLDAPLQLEAGQPAPAAGWLLSDASARKLVAHEADCTAALTTLGETSGVSPKVIVAGAAGAVVGVAATVAIVVMRSKL